LKWRLLKESNGKAKGDAASVAVIQTLDGDESDDDNRNKWLPG